MTRCCPSVRTRPALTQHEARLELERVASTQLDAKVVEAFLRVLDGPSRFRRAAASSGRRPSPSALVMPA